MRWWLRPVCWWRGHQWMMLRIVKHANSHLVHLHTYAGCDCDCERCGLQWRDADNFMRPPWVIDPFTDVWRRPKPAAPDPATDTR